MLGRLAGLGPARGTETLAVTRLAGQEWVAVRDLRDHVFAPALTEAAIFAVVAVGAPVVLAVAEAPPSVPTTRLRLCRCSSTRAGSGRSRAAALFGAGAAQFRLHCSQVTPTSTWSNSIPQLSPAPLSTQFRAAVTISRYGLVEVGLVVAHNAQGLERRPQGAEGALVRRDGIGPADRLAAHLETVAARRVDDRLRVVEPGHRAGLLVGRPAALTPEARRPADAALVEVEPARYALALEAHVGMLRRARAVVVVVARRRVVRVDAPRLRVAGVVRAHVAVVAAQRCVRRSPIFGSQLSVVQALWSSQLNGAWPQPVFESQLSIVQALWSSQLNGAWTQPVAESQLSVVQALWSSQLTGAWRAARLAGSQLSVVQALLVVAIHRCVAAHPVAGSQLSVVQALWSSQLNGAWRTPVAGSQLSVVQALLVVAAQRRVSTPRRRVAGVRRAGVWSSQLNGA